MDNGVAIDFLHGSAGNKSYKTTTAGKSGFVGRPPNAPRYGASLAISRICNTAWPFSYFNVSRFNAFTASAWPVSCSTTPRGTRCIMHPDLHNHSSTDTSGLQILLDGAPISLPHQRHSLAAIRAHLEILAMERQRILYSFSVDGARINLSAMLPTQRSFTKVEAETIDLGQVPLQMVKTALLQSVEAREQVLTAVTLTLINNAEWAREHWWNLIRVVKQPLVTLSLMPDHAHGSNTAGASLLQLRQWQLQQLAAILKDVEQACGSGDPAELSNTLEYRVLPWLHGLESSLELWHETLALG